MFPADVQTAARRRAQEAGTGDAVREWDWNRLLTPRVVFMMLPLVGLLVTAVHAEVPVARLRTMHYAYPTFHRTVEAALKRLG